MWSLIRLSVGAALLSAMTAAADAGDDAKAAVVPASYLAWADDLVRGEAKYEVRDGVVRRISAGDAPTLAEKPLGQWLVELRDSIDKVPPGVLRKDAAGVLERAYREKKTDDSAKRTILCLVLHHLLADRKEVTWAAFEALRHIRCWDRHYGDLLDERDRKLLLSFVKDNPTYGWDHDHAYGFQNMIVVLAECGDREEAKSCLAALDGKVPAKYQLSVITGLARLGREDCQQKLLKAYETEKDFEVRLHLAAALGIMSIPEALKLLARDLRNAEVGGEGSGWSGTGFNQLALAGLSWARIRPDDFPSFTRVGGFEQAHFDQAEAWCAAKLGVTWQVPQPPVRKLGPPSL